MAESFNASIRHVTPLMIMLSCGMLSFSSNVGIVLVEQPILE